jgi:glycine cleavage system transcriptional repressor
MDNRLIILTAIGPKDKPGIVAALTRTVLECGGNLDDATMTRLHGAFATMIAARVADSEVPRLRERLKEVSSRLSLNVAVEILADEDAAGPQSAASDHVITVYGADHPGIVHHVASLLEAHGANITDLETRLTRDGERPIYVMMVETSGGNWETLPHALGELARSMDIDVSFADIDEETL